jgi:autotransporter-associated beta strand protein
MLFQPVLTRALTGLFVAVAVLLGGMRFNAHAYTSADAQSMMSAFNAAYYFTNGSRGYFRNTTDGGTTWFWGRANQMEMLIDLYEQTTNTAYLAQFSSLYNGFVYDYGSNWIWNEYNDDIMWMVIACSRAYQKTGNTTFRNVAKNNFDSCYARAWSTNLGGGLWWKSPLNTSKNACVNGPGAIAAYLIYQNYGDTNYLAMAESLYQWERATLFDTNTGRVYDSINISGTKDTTPITYNQGTFIGAANFLGYTNDAILAANYTKNSMGSGGQLPNYEEDSDLGGFNGIFVRWMVKFMNQRGLQGNYQLWLQQNANAAWNVRRLSDNLSWSKWWDQTPGGTRYSFGGWGSVLVMNLLPPTQNPGGATVTLTASDASGTSSFESALNWSDGTAPSWTRHFLVTDGRVLRTPADAAHHTFAGSSLTLSNGGTLAFKNSSGGRYVSIGTDLFLDGGEVHDWAANSCNLGGKITLRPGGGKFDPQGNVMTVPALIGGLGQLRIGAGASSAVNGTVTLSGVNTYTGGTVIEAAHTLQVSGAGTLGSTSGSLTFTNAGRGFGTFNLNGLDLNVGNLNGQGGVIWNNKSGATNTLTVGNGDATGGAFQGTLLNGGGVLALNKSGTGTMTLTAASSYTGGTTISGGVLQLGDGLARNGAVTGDITNHATLAFANPLAQNFTGVIRGSGAVRKLGAGRLTFFAANTYGGGTVIQAGTLALSGSGSLGTGAVITLADGATLDVAGRLDQKLTLNAGQTLSGDGVIVGNLQANADSSILPGPGVGTLTVNGHAALGGVVLMELNRTNAQRCDRLHTTGMVTAGGVLTVTNLGPALQAGDVFTLFNVPVTGFAAVQLPSLDVGLVWVANLAVDGSIAVAPVVSTEPVEVTMHIASGALTLSWPGDHTGWRLQVQTNLLGVGLGTNWFDVTDSNTTNELTLPIGSANGSVFYRLIYP